MHPVLGMRLVGFITVIKLVGIIALLYALVYRSIGGGQRLLGSRIGQLFCVFTVFALASFIIFYDPLISHGKHIILISFFTLFLVALTFVDSKEKLRKCLWVCVIALFLGSISLIKGAIQYGGRAGGGFGDCNIYAANAVLILPIAYYLFLSEKRHTYRMILLGIMALMAVGIVMARSRGAAAGLLTVLLIMSWQSSKKIKAFLGVAMLIIILLPFVPESFWARMGLFGYEQDVGAKKSTEAHIQRWHAGLRMIKNHPLLGVGLDNFYYSLNKYLSGFTGHSAKRGGGQAHNGYIEITAELGIPGFCLYIAMIVFTFLALRKVKKRAIASSDHLMLNFAKGFQAGLAGFLVCVFFVNAQDQKLFWLVLFLVIVLDNLGSVRISTVPAFRPYSPLALSRNKIYAVPFKRGLQNHVNPFRRSKM
ncbi:MAG TPA: O-antigen ligase family protein [Candidatus Hypogeohydataceae bacterium YC41]